MVYWIREGHLWKRVHIQPRTTLYVPERTTDGPHVDNLLPARRTRIIPTKQDQTGPTVHEDNWQAAGNQQTNFEEKVEYKEQLDTDDDEQQEAQRAKGVKAPEQPTQQQIRVHNLTHLPYRNWCPICVESRGKADSHKKQTSKQPVIQIDFCYIKGIDEQQTTPILTAIDIQTGMISATLISDKQPLFEYATNQLLAFLMERGRTQAVLQSNQEDYLIALLQAVANKAGNNIAVRHSPAYSPKSQGTIERSHRTLVGQIRTIRAQIQCRGS